MRFTMATMSVLAMVLALAACEGRAVTGVTASSLEEATILNNDGTTVVPTSLAAGQHVKASVVAGADGALTARKIDITNKAPKVAGEVKVSGPAQAVDTAAGTVVILGITITVSPTAEFEGATASLAEIAVGAPVGIKGVIEADGSVTATSVETDLPKLDGLIESVSGTALPFTVKVVGKDVLVNQATVVKFKTEGGEGKGKGKGHGKGKNKDKGEKADDDANEQETEQD